ncbi:uncharacterized protein LOC116304383 [Actinia tenebrosa]|uniref:Uncharacterized protein LOC116304383 n=1 Tax=Actinia tenebrosa TaxID=6105 RepID=A0A6P8IUW6_ACTTE|nr:uncharacterized protein LOC116304383 [Actinia tenebrosa]
MVTLWTIFCLVYYVSMTTATQNTCPVVRYTGSFRAADKVSDYALLGHSYKNFTTSIIQECFNDCVMDCACVSYQLFGTRCELMDEDRQTEPGHFKEKLGYQYYELQQKFKQQHTPASCAGHCRNGCCRFVSCLNGGTCIEQCDDVKRKFKCQCRSDFTGKMCEHPMTCAAYGAGRTSGEYPITLPSGDKINVFCDFTSEPGFVWTLIESFAFSKHLDYKTKPFTVDFPVNPTAPTWDNYRLSRSVMLYVKSNSTLWRATCKYDTDGLSTRDYMKGLLKYMDILAHQSGDVCAKVLYIDIRGINCTECTTHFRQSNRHPYVDCAYGRNSLGCTFDASSGGVRKNKDGYWSWDDNFGYYHVHNPNHRCSSSSSSTTQWWLGTPV